MRVALSNMTTPMKALSAWVPDPDLQYDTDDLLTEDGTGVEGPPDSVPPDPPAAAAARLLPASDYQAHPTGRANTSVRRRGRIHSDRMKAKP